MYQHTPSPSKTSKLMAVLSEPDMSLYHMEPWDLVSSPAEQHSQVKKRSLKKAKSEPIKFYTQFAFEEDSGSRTDDSDFNDEFLKYLDF